MVQPVKDNNYTENLHKISIIVPVKDEEASISGLAKEIDEIMGAQPHEWETLWINDGSTDNTLDILKELNKSNKHHRYLSFSVNCGQSAALVAGFKTAEGDVIATLDGDGQNDPRDIPDVVYHIFTGSADMVNGYRVKRHDSIIRKLSSKIANGFRNMTTGRVVSDVGCSTRAFKKECVEDLPLFKGLHRFLPTLIDYRGFRLMEVPVNHRPRTKGNSKYSISNRLWVGIYDIFGITWLKHRGFRYEVKEKN